MLVNIQSHEQFASHMLNRDTWTHETIESILRTTYLLWQRGHTSGDGAAYMRMHRLTDEDLPHIGIIDPRTGAKLLTLVVCVYANVAICPIVFVSWIVKCFLNVPTQSVKWEVCLFASLLLLLLLLCRVSFPLTTCAYGWWSSQSATL